MKAVRVNAWQQPIQLEDIPQPALQRDGVLVRVRAASINPFDSAVAAGYMSFMATPPLTPGTDFAVQEERFEDVVEGVNIILDYVGGEYLGRSFNILKPGDRYVTALMMETPQDEAQRRGIHSFGLASQPRADYLAKVAELVDTGKLKVFVNRTFPLEQIAEAMDFRLKTTAPGKIVLTIQ